MSSTLTACICSRMNSKAFSMKDSLLEVIAIPIVSSIRVQLQHCKDHGIGVFAIQRQMQVELAIGDYASSI